MQILESLMSVCRFKNDEGIVHPRKKVSTLSCTVCTEENPYSALAFSTSITEDFFIGILQFLLLPNSTMMMS